MKNAHADLKPQMIVDERGRLNWICDAGASRWTWRLEVGRVAPRAPQDGAETLPEVEIERTELLIPRFRRTARSDGPYL